jgi:hypothetical protein
MGSHVYLSSSHVHMQTSPLLSLIMTITSYLIATQRGQASHAPVAMEWSSLQGHHIPSGHREERQEHCRN